MRNTKDTAQAARTAAAMDRVLATERDAEARLTQARKQAHDTLELARQDALAAVNHAMQRVAAWQRAHAAASDHRLAVLRDQAASLASDAQPVDEAALVRAVEGVANRLTGGSESEDGPGAEGDERG